MATIWLATTIYLFSQGWAFAATVTGAVLLVPAALVAFTDVCLPSMLYNMLFLGRLNPKTD